MFQKKITFISKLARSIVALVIVKLDTLGTVSITYPYNNKVG
jgi:hypothetical protein